MKKRLISIVLTVLLLGTLFVPAASAKERFTDISGHWAEECIVRLAEAEIVHGYPDGSVKPDRAITRGEFASLLVHAAGFDTEADGPWPQKYFDALSDYGVLEDGEELSGDGFITRMEIVAWTLKTMEYEKNAINEEEILEFSDTEDLSETERGFLTGALASGLLNGYPDGTVRPGANCTRAEAFMIISKYEKAKGFLEEASRPGISAGTGLPQMSVSLEGPETAEAYSPIEIKVHHKNVEKLEWTITGNEDKSQRSNSVWESDLNEDGGTVTFYEAGHYDLHAKAYSGAGQEGEYLLGIEVKEPAIRLEAPEEIPVYYDTHIEAHPRSDVTELVWTITRDGEPAQAGAYFGTLENTGGTISFQQDGIYKLTLSGKDGLGKPVSASCSILSYQQIWQSLYGPDIAYVGESVYYGISEFFPAEGSTLQWQVLENAEIKDWDTVIDGQLQDCTSGMIQFRQAGKYTVRLKITDRLGHVTDLDSSVAVYDPILYSLDMPETAYMGDLVHVTAEGLDDSFEPVEWTVNGKIGGCDSVVMGDGPANHSGCVLIFQMPGTYRVGLSVTHSNGQNVAKYKTIRIYPIVSVRLDMPETAYVGDAVSIAGSYDCNYDGLTPEWKLEKDGEPVNAEDFLTGELGTGPVAFREAGTYKVTVFVTDALERDFSDSRTISVSDVPELPEPVFSVSEIAYVDTPFHISFENDLSECSIQWNCFMEDGHTAENAMDGSIDSAGGTLTPNNSGKFVISVTVEDGGGNSKTAEQTLTVKEKPHVRMNPLDRDTYEERFDYVYILHVGHSSTTYPGFSNTEGMTTTFELLENGEPVGEEAAYFTSQSKSYTFQPRRTGEFEVRATTADKFGNTFVFTARYKAVPLVVAKLTDLPQTAMTGEQLEISVTPRNVTDETVEWKLSTISEEAAEPFMSHGLKNLWLWATDWQEIEMDQVSYGSLSDSGGQLAFFTPGIYCLRTSVTDQYNETTESFSVIQIIGC